MRRTRVWMTTTAAMLGASLAMGQDAPEVPVTLPADSTTQPAGAAAAKAPAQASMPALISDALLAQRIVGMAQDMLHFTTPTPASWEQASALLAAAMKLDPSDPRYPQLLAEACTRAGDIEGAINALKAYRKVVPGDQTAIIKIVELYMTRIQVAEKRLEYLSTILENPSIPAEVRSYVAMQASRLYRERSQMSKATSMIEQAIRLNPLNAEALDAKWDMTSESATRAERVGQLLAMMRANPAQPNRAADLADQLADVGLLRPSLDWYALAVKLWNARRQAPPHRFVVRYAAQFYLVDRTNDSDNIARQMLQVDPSDVDALYLRLLSNKALPADQYKALLEQAADMLRGRVMASGKPPTTQPADPAKGPLPDLSAQIAEARKPENQQMKRAMAVALSDLAWFQVYFAIAPEGASATLDAFKKLTEGDTNDSVSIATARIEGWILLIQNRTQEATVKLSAVSQRDALAAMGLAKLMLINGKNKSDGQTAARDAIAMAPGGLLGAMVWDGLRDLGAKRFSDNSAEMILDAVNKFPLQWLQIVDTPSNFYSIRGEPVRGAFDYGEPMLANVTITNQSDFDIPIGYGGVLQPDLWFDAQLRGLAEQNIPGVAYDRITQVLVLRPKQSISQIVRVDQGNLGPMMQSQPTPAFQVFISVMTNPLGVSGGIAPGPAGLRTEFSRIFARNPFPIGSEQSRQTLITNAESGNPKDKFSAIDMLTAVVQSLSANKELAGKEETQQLIGRFAGTVRQARTDSLSSVSTWAWFKSLQMDPIDADRVVTTMLNSDVWTNRLMGLIGSGSLKEGRADAIKTLADNDPDPLVKKLAAATLKRTQQATTQPVTEQTDTPVIPPAN